MTVIEGLLGVGVIFVHGTSLHHRESRVLVRLRLRARFRVPPAGFQKQGDEDEDANEGD